MDQDLLVSGSQKLAAELEQEEGPLALFMLLAPDTETDVAWNVIVSAPGLDAKSRGTAVSLVSELLRRNVARSEWRRILRVTVLHTSDPFVRAMNATFHTEHSVRNLQSCNVAGIDIPRAVLFESRRVAA